MVGFPKFGHIYISKTGAYGQTWVTISLFSYSYTFQVAYDLEYSVVCFDSLHPYIDLPNFCKYN